MPVRMTLGDQRPRSSTPERGPATTSSRRKAALALGALLIAALILAFQWYRNASAPSDIVVTPADNKLLRAGMLANPGAIPPPGGLKSPPVPDR